MATKKKENKVTKKEKEKKIEDFTVKELITICEQWDDCSYGCLLYNLGITKKDYCPVQMLASIHDKTIKVKI